MKDREEEQKKMRKWEGKVRNRRGREGEGEESGLRSGTPCLERFRIIMARGDT